eukprot:1161056-Pelagomonas_calceolata.AAC.3
MGVVRMRKHKCACRDSPDLADLDRPGSGQLCACPPMLSTKISSTPVLLRTCSEGSLLKWVLLLALKAVLHS